MFGLEEKEKKKKPKRFEFDLEKRMKEDPKFSKGLFEKIEKEIGEIKNHLRKGSKGEDFDQLAVLLNGYTALQKVLKKVTK